MQERRQHRRIHVPSVVLRVKEGGELRRRYFRDLSRDGIFIQTSDVSEVGTRITIRLEPRGGAPAFEIPARVVRVAFEKLPRHSRPSGMALAFVDLTGETLDRLEHLLAELET